MLLFSCGLYLFRLRNTNRETFLLLASVTCFFLSFFIFIFCFFIFLFFSFSFSFFSFFYLFFLLIPALLLEAQSTPFQVTPSTMANIVKGLYTLRPGKHLSFLLGLGLCFYLLQPYTKGQWFFICFVRPNDIWVYCSKNPRT